MSCTSCFAAFSFGTKEFRCEKCAFPYCSRCFDFRYHLGDKRVKKVCRFCYCEDTSVWADESYERKEILERMRLAPVDIENKMEGLDNPVKPPITIYQKDRWDHLKVGLEPEDQAIVDRLKRLKEEHKKPPPVTTDEIRRRLARLRDEDPDYVRPANTIKPDTRSDQEKADDLIQEYMARLELSKHDLKSDEDMERRLNQLKGINPSTASGIEYPDEATVTKNIVARALAEAALEKKFGVGKEDEDEEMKVQMPIKYGSDEEFECAMCDRKKNLVQCVGCTGDIYCPACFEDYHDEMEKHPTVPVKRR